MIETNQLKCMRIASIIDARERVTIATYDPVARAAIHNFVHFPITYHGTGDPLDVEAAE